MPNTARKAIRYLLLRQELMQAYKAKVARHKTLATLLALYRTNGTLAPSEIRQVVQFEATQHKKEKLKNLLDVHAAYHILAQRIDSLPPGSFEESVQKSLLQYLWLTPLQLQKLQLGMPPTSFT